MSGRQIALQFSGALLVRPAQKFSHPMRRRFRLKRGVAMVMLPVRPPHHHVIKMNGPLVDAAMLDHAPTEFGWENAADVLGLTRREQRFRRRATWRGKLRGFTGAHQRFNHSIHRLLGHEPVGGEFAARHVPPAGFGIGDFVRTRNVRRLAVGIGQQRA